MNQKINLEGRGTVAISDQNHIATGGEGSVYRVANTVIKVFIDPRKMDGMRDKIKRLTQFKCNYIVAPEGLALNQRGDPIGFYMPFVDATAMSLVFTNDFRNREGITDQDASSLTFFMRETFSYAHSNNAILVDPNELNWLAILKGKNGAEPRVIDVDSWILDGKLPVSGGIPKMLSIQDFHGKTVSKESDWFAFAIVSFQIYVGLHPFKGMLDGYKPSELERRMKDNASVFHAGVRLNKAVRDFSCIPSKLLDWFIGVFEHSDRSIPPSPYEAALATPAAIQVARVVTTATGKLKFERLLDSVVDNSIRIFSCGIVLQNSLDLIDLSTKRGIGSAKSTDCEIIRVKDGWLKSDASKFFYISAHDHSQVEIPVSFTGRKVVVADNRMFLVTERGFTELVFRLIGRPILAAGQTWGAMVNSTHWFDGVGVQDAIGAMYLILPFGGNSCAQIRTRELDGLKPITAKAGSRFASVIAIDDSGTYRKIEFYFSADYSSYKVWSGTSESAELNLAILQRGVCATIVEDGQLVIFVPSSGAVNKISDKQISTDMTLATWEESVVYIQNGQVWKVSIA